MKTRPSDPSIFACANGGNDGVFFSMRASVVIAIRNESDVQNRIRNLPVLVEGSGSQTIEVLLCHGCARFPLSIAQEIRTERARVKSGKIQTETLPEFPSPLGRRACPPGEDPAAPAERLEPAAKSREFRN
jgi:hypothetical protein